MTTLEIFKKIYNETEVLSLDDDDGVTCAPCDLEKWQDTSYGTEGLTLSLTDFQLNISPENIEQGTFREDGTFDCTAQLLYYGEIEGEPLQLEIVFKKLQIIKP